jgi:hypothetical protein
MTEMSSWQAKAPVMAVVPGVALMDQKVNVLLVVMRSSASVLPGVYHPEQTSSGKERRSAYCQNVAHCHRCRRRPADRRLTRDRSCPSCGQAPQAAGASLSAATTLPGHISLTSGSGDSWTTHGNNAQLTIQGSGETDFYLTATSDTGYYKIHVANSSHCVEGEGGGNKAVIATDCAQGSINQRWGAFPYNGGCKLRNEATGLYATVYDDTNGKPVWESDGNVSGSFRAWSTNLWVGC